MNNIHGQPEKSIVLVYLILDVSLLYVEQNIPTKFHLDISHGHNRTKATAGQISDIRELINREYGLMKYG